MSTESGVQSIDRACTILKCFTKQVNELSLCEISERTNLPKSTVHRILHALECNGLICQEEDSGYYHLDHALIKMGDIARESFSDISKIALPEAKWLSEQCEQTVNLYVQAKNKRICIEQVKGPRYVSRYSQIGNSLPLYCGASGLVILANMPTEKLNAYLSTVEIEPFTSNTVTSKERLKESVSEVRKNGYAFTCSERELYTASIAAPILNADKELVAVMALSGPETMFDEEHVKEYIVKVKEAARRTSARFGYLR